MNKYFIVISLILMAGMLSCDDDSSSNSANNSNNGTQNVCPSWNSDTDDMDEGDWSGDVATCTAGDVNSIGRNNALKMINLYRWMAGLPSVDHDSTLNDKAQECALMMDANNTLSHTPPDTWDCYTADGDDGAGHSNIATTPGVEAVGLYMIDPGNPSTLGHRRWILSNSLGPVGLGTTNSYSCMYVLGGSGDSVNEWTAWPPPGEFPIEAVSSYFSSIDQTGWSVQSDYIDLSSAVVEVRNNGSVKPVDVTVLSGGYGSVWAISFIPDGWTTEADNTYSVKITGVATEISYNVEVVDCSVN
jgi:Cysteine-rich secretory protein family